MTSFDKKDLTNYLKTKVESAHNDSFPTREQAIEYYKRKAKRESSRYSAKRISRELSYLNSHGSYYEWLWRWWSVLVAFISGLLVGKSGLI